MNKEFVSDAFPVSAEAMRAWRALYNPLMSSLIPRRRRVPLTSRE
jgi:hypothetical protein